MLPEGKSGERKLGNGEWRDLFFKSKALVTENKHRGHGEKKREKKECLLYFLPFFLRVLCV